MEIANSIEPVQGRREAGLERALRVADWNVD
jgi:hypothetical protein